MVGPTEIFPYKQLTQGIYYEQIFDIAYFPNERGPYNYNPSLDNNGMLTNPQSSWGAITKAVTSETDFDKANIEYIEFWMMDPFIYKSGSAGGDLYFNLGSISEDILKDGRKSLENGLPGGLKCAAGAVRSGGAHHFANRPCLGSPVMARGWNAGFWSCRLDQDT